MKQSLLLAAAALLLAGTALTACKNKNAAPDETAEPAAVLTPVAFSADSALAYVEAQCAFGPRVPNSAAHRACGDWIVEKFRSFGLEVTQQEAVFTGWAGKRLDGRNLIASYRPKAEERVVLAAHWDCRPWADADPDSSRHREPVMGANDGASGVAVLLEMARLVGELQPQVGVDFVCFDAEDYGAPYWGTPDPEGNDWCLGSQLWARQAAAQGYRARYGVLLDMVGGRDARFCYEGFSKRYAEAVMLRLWQTAESVGADHLFLPQDGSWATDDHLPMNQVAGIPTVDVVPYVGPQGGFGATWHTVNDTPENISKETLRLVGQTLLQLLSEEQAN